MSYPPRPGRRDGDDRPRQLDQTRTSSACPRDIALTQHGQIGNMQAWLRDWSLSPTGTEPPMAWMPDGAGAVQNGLMPGMATAAEMTAAARRPPATTLDILFLTLMRQHHLGGIHMAQAILEQSDNDDVTLAGRDHGHRPAGRDQPDRRPARRSARPQADSRRAAGTGWRGLRRCLLGFVLAEPP